MSLAVIHMIVNLPHCWHVSQGNHGWWIWRVWPAGAMRAARTYGMEGFGMIRGHMITASQWRTS